MVTTAVAAAALLWVAVLLWPTRSGTRTRVVRRLLQRPRTTSVDAAREMDTPGNRDTGAGTGVVMGDSLSQTHSATGIGRLRRIWHEDPAELFRLWRARRRPDALLADALSVLEGVEPAIRAGLTPADAVRLATRVGRLGPDGAGDLSADRPTPVHSLEAALVDGVSRGVPLSDVWHRLAVRTGSADLGFVASAWHLSESTGAPLAAAVERAAEGLRQARSRRRRVAVAVAGPRATVTVLTVLPLTGPLFGLACGIGPYELYLASPLATVSALTGVALIAVGRRWCLRLVRRAVRP